MFFEVHPFSIPALSNLVSRGAGAYPSGHRARGGVHPGQVARPSQRHTETNETNNHAHWHCTRDNLESPINLTCMLLDGGRKPEYLERTHAHMGRTCKLQDSNQELSGCEATMLTTTLTATPLCSPLWSSVMVKQAAKCNQSREILLKLPESLEDSSLPRLSHNTFNTITPNLHLLYT